MAMLRANLAVKPFYNERLVSFALIVLAAVVAVLTIFNGTRLVSLSSRRSALRTAIASDQAETATIRAAATTVQGSVDRAALQELASATQLANRLIGARTFSWTTFFGHIEDTIPYDVRVTAVSPEVEDGEITVTMLLVGRSENDIETFASALERTGAFYDVRYTVADSTEDRLKRVTMTARYLAGSVPQPVGPPPSAARTETTQRDGGRR